nr:sialidase [Gemmatimonadales bacterium]NIN13286.1 sialidase [Gemmatimonadales bacterium]NIQ99747.1 sialidase [Gemmatimonadales bacterium]NIS64244.1 sialidase [Gemmatimonadales bacterium]
GRMSLLVPPGTYTVTLQVGDQEYTQQLQVLKDPNTEGTEEDIRAQTAMLRDIRGDMNAAADMINRIEWIRRQLYDLKAVLEDQGGAEEIVTAARELDEQLVGVEDNLIQLKLTGTGQDGVRWPAMLVGKLGHLASGVAVGDFPPTDQQREVHQLLKQRLARYQGELDELLRTNVVEFNRVLRERNLAPVISGLP